MPNRSPLQKYLSLIQEHPEWFYNPDESGTIRIITDPERILVEQRAIRLSLQRAGKPTCWIDVGVLAEDEWFYVVRDIVEFPNGRVGGYIRWVNRKSQEQGGYNVILLCHQEGRILLIRTFRHQERTWCWEFPRGFGEAGLSAEANAQRELREELGLSEGILTCLAQVSEGSGGTAVFWVDLPAQAQITMALEESITDYRWLDVAELDRIVQQGQLKDWFSLWAYALAKSSRLI